MPFVAARCPQCGGELQLDDQKETGFCMHCGSKIIVSDAIRAVRIDSSHMIGTWRRMGKSALEAQNYEEAYSYFKKVAEETPTDWNALFYKGLAAGLLSTAEQPRIHEFVHGMKLANEIIDGALLSEAEKREAKILFPPAVIQVCQAHLDSIEKRNKNIEFKKKHKDIMLMTLKAYEEAIGHYLMVLEIVKGYDDDISNQYKLDLKKETVLQCVNVCFPITYHTDDEKNEVNLFGYSAKEKQKFSDLYDELIVEIRLDIPGYKSDRIVDRISPPPETAPAYKIDYSLPTEVNNMTKLLAYVDRFTEHWDKAEEAEGKAEKVRLEKEEHLRKLRYWESHPEEYQSFLAEEKRRKDEAERKKSYLSTELEKKTSQFTERETLVRETITRLKGERETLSIFSGKQKREIDEKIDAINKQTRELSEEINSLKREFERYK